MTNSQSRASGLKPLDEIPWGSHICAFYATTEDLLELVVPYIAEGLKANERCVWVTSPPLTPSAAADSLAAIVPDVGRFIDRGQLAIIPHDQWYLEDGVFDADRVLSDWGDTHDEALDQGYDGLRVTGNTAWLESPTWDAFAEYERTIDGAVIDRRMLVL